MERHGLHALRATDPDVRELRGVIETAVVGESDVRGLGQDEPHVVAIGCSLVQRQANGLLRQINLKRAFQDQLTPRKESGQLAQTAGRAWRLIVRLGGRCPMAGDCQRQHRKSEQDGYQRSATASETQHLNFHASPLRKDNQTESTLCMSTLLNFVTPSEDDVGWSCSPTPVPPVTVRSERLSSAGIRAATNPAVPARWIRRSGFR